MKPTRPAASASSTLRRARRPVIEEVEPRILYSADINPGLLDEPAPLEQPEQRLLDGSGEFTSAADSESVVLPDVATSDSGDTAAPGSGWELELLLAEDPVPSVDDAYQPSMLDAAAEAPTSAQAQLAVASTPLAFEYNVGQTDAQVDFLARGSGYAVWLTDGDAVIALDGADGGYVLRLDVLGADPDAIATGEGLFGGTSNYLIGAQDQWHTGLANYQGVYYDDIYDGIDLRYYGNQRQLEYDFILDPGADVAGIRLAFDGAQGATIADSGELVLDLGEGQVVVFKAPVSWQDGTAGRESVTSHYILFEDGSVGFEVGRYDSSRELVIDPIFAYGTYLGGSQSDQIWNMDVDDAGNVYVTGFTNSINLPTTTGAYSGYVASTDTFVSKFTPDLGTLIYSTYIGGSNDELGYGIAADAAGNAYVTGYTTSSNFPLVSAYQSTLQGNLDAFVLKLNASGTGLVFSTLLGGSSASGDYGYDVAVDGGGSVYVAGYTYSTDFPLTAGALDTVSAGGEAFVTKFASTGSSLVYSTFLGGSGFDVAYNIEVDAAGNAVVVGSTESASFTTTLPGAYQAANNSVGNKSDAFVAKLNTGGTGLLYGTFLGGNFNDDGYGLALDAGGKIYLTGFTDSDNFDVTAGAMQTSKAGGADGFLSIIDPFASGFSSLIYSTYVGGSGTESIWGIDVDAAGKVYLAGDTNSTNLPVTGNAYQSSNAGSQDIFVMLIDPAGSGAADRVYASYLGGGSAENAWGARYANGTFYVAGNTSSASGITTVGAYDTTFNGGIDGYVAAFSFVTPPVVTTIAGALAYAEGAGPVPVDPGVSVTDADGSTLASAIVQITGNYVNGEDVLAFNNANPWSITGTWVPATGSLILNGVASLANYQAALRSVTYENMSEQPSTLTRSVSFSANDGALGSAPAMRQIGVSSLNDPAVNTVPGMQLGNEDTPVVFSVGNGNSISVADVDAGAAPIQVTLTAINGRLTLAQTSGLAFVSGDGSADANMTFTGASASINSALDGLRFDPNADYSGPAGLTIATNDLGNSGTGGAQITSSTVAIDLSPVNDAPVQFVLGAQSTAQNTPLVFSSGTGNAIVVSDIDAGSGELRVTLTGTNGTLTLASTVGLSSVAGDGTSVVTITGALANLNGALDGLTFTPALNYNGPASVTVATDDQGNTGLGGSLGDSDVIAITVSPNAASVITMSSAPLAYPEGAPATPVDGGLTLSDPDNPILHDARVSIVSGYVQGEDELIFADQLGITGSWDAMTGTLSLTGAVSIADYETALRSVAFSNSSDDPSGTRTVSFLVNDGVADSSAASRSVTLVPQNDAPVITVPGLQTVREDTPLLFSVATGNRIHIDDVDAGAGSIQLSLLATNGTLSLLQTTGLTFVSGADGTGSMSFSATMVDINAALSGLRFIPAGDFAGPADVQIVAHDLGNSGGGSLSDSRTVQINVTSVNDAPVGTDATVTTSEETPYVFSVLDFGFTDPKDSPGDSFQAVRIAALPGGGTLTCNGAAVTFGDFISMADIAAGGLVYTPFADDNGAGYASLGFQVQDSGGIADGGTDLDALVRTLTIDVDAVNDAPVVTVPGVQATPQNTSLVFTVGNGNAITVSDVDAGAALLRITLTAGNGTLLAGPLVGSASVTGDRTAVTTIIGTLADVNSAMSGLSFTPDLNYNGAATLQIEADDQGNSGAGGAQTSIATISITVGSNAAAQVTMSAAALTYSENEPAIVVAPGLTVSDPDSSVLDHAHVKITGNYVSGEDMLEYVFNPALPAITATWDPGAGELTLWGAASPADFQAALRTVTYRNLSDAPSTATRTITIAVEDGTSVDAGSFASRPLNVFAVNDAPLITVPPAQTGSEDTPLVFSQGAGNAISIADVDAAGGSLRLTLSATNGVLILSTTAGLTFNAGGNGSASMIVTGSDTDLNAALDGLQFDPAADYSGVALVSLSVDDLGNTGSGGALNDTGLISISILSVNDPPYADDDSATTTEDAPLNVPVAAGVLANDTDLDGDTLTVSAVEGNPADVGNTITLASGALLRLNADGSFDYDPNGAFDWIAAGDTDFDSFSYEASDPSGLSSGATVTITLTGVNDVPTGFDTVVAADEDTPYVFSSADFGFADPDGSLQAVTIVSLPAQGSLTLAGAPVAAGAVVSEAQVSAGDLVFLAAADQSGAGYASFRVRVSDGVASAAGTTSVTIDVAPVNDLPLVADNAVTGSEDVVVNLTVAQFTSAFSDLEGDSLVQVEIIALPADGSLTLSGTPVAVNDVIPLAQLGNLEFTPAADWNGTTLFAWKGHDGIGYSAAAANMTLTLAPINDAPLLTVGTAGGSVLWRGTLTLSPSMLQVDDVDNPPAELVYTISALPGAGTLYRAGVALAVNGTFTQDDISAGLVRYTHAGGTSSTDGFAFTVTDGAGGSIGATAFNIAIAPAPPPVPVVTPPPPPPPPSGGGTAPPTTDPGSGGSTTGSTGSSVDPQPTSDTPVSQDLEAALLGAPAPQLNATGAETRNAVDARAHSVRYGQVVVDRSVAGYTIYANTLGPLVGSTSTDEGSGSLSVSGTLLSGFAVERTDLLASIEAMTHNLSGTDFVGELDTMRDQLDGKIEVQAQLVASSVAVTGGLSVGYVIWLLRGGLLLSSLLSSMPAWHAVDPMPVLARGGSDDDEGADEDPLERLFGKAKDRLLGGWRGKATTGEAPPEAAEAADANTDASMHATVAVTE